MDNKHRWQVLSVDDEGMLHTSVCGRFADIKKALKYVSDIRKMEDERLGITSEIISIIRLTD